MDVADNVRSGARWLGAAKLITQVYSWIITILVMRILAPNDYALMAMAAVIISFVSQFQELGVRVKLVQMQDYTLAYARSVYGLVLVVNFAIMAGLFLISPLIAAFFNQADLVAIVMALAVGLAISSVGSVPEALIQRQLEFRKLALIEIVAITLSSTLTLVMAASGFGVWSLVLSSLFGAVLRAVCLSFASSFGSAPSFDFSGLGDTLKFGGFVMSQHLAWWLYVSLDTLLIGRFYPAHMLGLYSTSVHLATMPLQKVGSILHTLSFTGLARVATEMDTFRHYLLRGVKIVSVVMFPAFLGIAAVAFEFVPVVLGEKWEGVAPIMALLALSAPARSVTEVVTESLNALGKPGLQFRCMAVTAGLTALGIVSGLPFGLEEVAAGVAVSSIVACLNNLRIVGGQAGIPFRDFALELWPQSFAAVLMLVALVVIRPLLPIAFPSLFGLLATISIGAVVYGLAIAVVNREVFRVLRSAVMRG